MTHGPRLLGDTLRRSCSSFPNVLHLPFSTPAGSDGDAEPGSTAAAAFGPSAYYPALPLASAHSLDESGDERALLGIATPGLGCRFCPRKVVTLTERGTGVVDPGPTAAAAFVSATLLGNELFRARIKLMPGSEREKARVAGVVARESQLRLTFAVRASLQLTGPVRCLVISQTAPPTS